MEVATANLGGGVGELKVSLLEGPPFGLHQRGLAEGEHLLLGSHHIAFQRDKVTGHFAAVHSATQRADTLVRQVVTGAGVLDQFATLDEVAWPVS